MTSPSSASSAPAPPWIRAVVCGFLRLLAAVGILLLSITLVELTLAAASMLSAERPWHSPPSPAGGLWSAIHEMREQVRAMGLH
jgi:hypothetical protein